MDREKNPTEKLDKKDIIINTAFDLFAEKGFSETSMDDIVKESGISKGGIYHHFKSKEEIFLEIAKIRMNERNKIVEESSNYISNKERLSNYMDWVLLGYFQDRIKKLSRFTFQFWSMLGRNETIKERAKERYEMVYKKLSEILEKGISEGEFKNDLDVKSMVYIILSNLDGIGFLNGVMGIDIDMNVVENYKDMIFQKVCKGDNDD